MTQVESGKEEGAQPTKCDNNQCGDSSGPSSHTEIPPTKKLQHPKTEACSFKKSAGEMNISSPHHNLHQRPRSAGANSKTLKVYKNGESQECQELNFKKDAKNAKTWSAVLDMLSAAVSSKNSENFNVAKVFTTQGRKVLSASDLESCNEIVVCGAEPYQTLPYGSPFSDSHYNRKFINNKVSRPVRRPDRDAVVRSVIFDPPSSIVEEISQNQPGIRKHPMVKTLSEQDVSMSNIENSAMSESMSPKMRPRNTHSPKPRPVSAYHQVASVHGGDRRSPMTGLVSRIPKRIISSNNNNRGSSPNVAAVNSVNNAITNNNMNNRNGSQRRAPEIKVPSERASRHDTSRREFIRPRLVTIIRHGMKPRRAVRFLLNKKTARSYDQVLNDITESIKPDWGAVRRVYTLNGAEVLTLEDFFGSEDIFLACANDRINPEDLELDFEECKAIQPYVKATLVHKHSRTLRGLDSKSPQRKSGKGTSSNPQTAQAAVPSHPKDIPLSHFPSPILDKYEVGGIIGDGNFAVVRDCTDRKSKQRYALKVIDKSKCNGRDVPPEHEIAILTTVSHPNIIVLYEQYDFSNELYVVMELVEGGDLFDAIAYATKFSEKDSKSMTKDIASALEYLHTRNIVHRDIKPENLLVYFEENLDRRIKLGDFGLAQVVTGPMYTVCGTPTYVAPEILAETGYGLKVDIWALGVIVYVLLCGYPPFVSPTGDQEDLFDLILSGDFEFHREHWDVISMDAKDIVGRMIEPDSDARLTATEVLQHPWLATNSQEREERRRKMFQRDFRLTVFEAMGLSNMDSQQDQEISS